MFQCFLTKEAAVHTDAKLHYYPQPRECVRLSSSQDEPEYEQVDDSAETGFTISTNIAYSTVNIWYLLYKYFYISTYTNIYYYNKFSYDLLICINSR